MKRSIQTILFLASLAAVGCSSDASSPGTSPAGMSGTGNTAGNGAGGASTAGAAGAAGVSGGPVAGGGAAGAPPAGGGAAGADPGEPPVLPNGITGPVTGTLTGTNSVWGPGDITVTGAVTIPAGVTLTINKGTHVVGAFPITATGGAFKCNGMVTDPITIVGGSIALTGGVHTMQFCIVNSQAMTAIDVNGAQLTASHIQIQNFLASGIRVHGAGASVKLNFVTIGSKSTLFTGDMVGKEGVGVVIDADAGMGGSSITNSVLGFLNNGTNIGLKILGPSNTHLAYDNITSAASVLMTSDAPIGILTKDPNIADIPNLDHNLAFFSADLDQADPAADFSKEPAPNGKRANLGYHGGTVLARPTTVQLLSPNGCESITPGATTVLWQSSPNTGAKTLELSVDGGTTWAPLAKVAAGADTGSAQVTLPNTPTDQAKIRFSQDNDPTNIMDVSERVFAIGKPKNAAACANLRAPCTTGCKPFHVICYTGYRENFGPLGVPGPNEPTEAQVREDLKLLQPLTHGIRTYGSNPLLHDGASVPKVADELDLDLHMGIWIDDISRTTEHPDPVAQEAANMKALNDSIEIVNNGNHKSIKTLIISNEYLLRVRQDFPSDPMKTAAAEARLVTYLNYVRSKITNKKIPIVIGESYPDWLTASKALYDAVDIVMWHVHPWWQQVFIDNAAASAQTAHEAVLARMKLLGVSKPELLAETGFPWGEKQGMAQGSEDNQAKYLHDLNQYSLKVNLNYWFFEAFDEAWKGKEGPVGGKWGMFTAVRTAPPHKIISSINTLVPSAEGWVR